MFLNGDQLNAPKLLCDDGMRLGPSGALPSRTADLCLCSAGSLKKCWRKKQAACGISSKSPPIRNGWVGTTDIAHSSVPLHPDFINLGA